MTHTDTGGSFNRLEDCNEPRVSSATRVSLGNEIGEGVRGTTPISSDWLEIIKFGRATDGKEVFFAITIVSDSFSDGRSRALIQCPQGLKYLRSCSGCELMSNNKPASIAF